MKYAVSLFIVLVSNLAFAEKAVFGGGCFWCMEPPYEKLDGVSAVLSGYAGGEEKTAKYDQVSVGGTGHIEVVEVTYDPAKVTYEKLLEVYFKNIDPFDAIGQFCDKGDSYISAIFTANDNEKKLAEEKLKKVQEAKKALGKVATKIIPLKKFYAAEDYHQDYYKKNPIRFKYYKTSCGREARLKTIGL